MRVLIVEDEPMVASTVERVLVSHGHQVLTAETGDDAVLLARTEPVDLVLLDIQLPDKDGHQVLAEIRRLRSDLPVIMLTARDDLKSKLSALDGGADDYITKPFDFAELLSRMRAITRRADQPQSSTLEFGDLRIELLANRVWRGGQQIELSSREFALLEYFALNPDRLLSRQQILSAVWDYGFAGESNIVDVYIRNLRSKLDRDGERSLFTTVRGRGYRFDPPPAR